jgi:hypothetical protein
MSQDQAVAAPSRTSTFRNELNDAVGIDGPGYRPSYESSHHGDIWSHHSQHMCRFRVSIAGFS